MKHPPLTQPDPTEHLVEMMRDLVQTNGARFFVGLQRHDARYESFLHAKHIPFVSFDDAEAYPTHGNHWTPKGNAFVADRLRALLAKGGG